MFSNQFMGGIHCQFTFFVMHCLSMSSKWSSVETGDKFYLNFSQGHYRPCYLFQSDLFEIGLQIELKSLKIKSNSLAIPAYYSQSKTPSHSSQDMHYNIR